VSAAFDRLVIGGVVLGAAIAAFVLVKPKAPGAADVPADGELDDVPVAVVSASASASASEPPKPPPPAYVRENEDSAAACGKGMLLVDGVYCPFVGHTCARFLDEPKDICASFGPDVLCEGRLVHRRFCVDRFEYPNLDGVKPAVLVSFDEARAACDVEGKRLCDAEEWEFACEGPGMWPYPTGRERDKQACNLDQPAPDDAAVAALLADPRLLSQGFGAADGPRSGSGVHVDDKRVASGALAGCISPFGVRDLSGNVGEWVVGEGGKTHEAPYQSAIKGGSWQSSKATCRPLVTSFDASHRALDLGFRCCKDARGSPKKEPATGVKRLKKSRMP
jgi:hypothetical protein